MQLAIHTQYMENYGYRWKFKGGKTVIITNLCVVHDALEI